MNIKTLLIVGVLLLFGAISVFAQDYSSAKSSETVMVDGKKFFLHTIVKGNTLYNLSKTYGVSKEVINKYNPEIKEGLSLGLKIKIPYAQTSNSDFIYHIVKKKETLYQISRIYNVPSEEIIKLNNLKNDQINPGAYLKIPNAYMASPSSNNAASTYTDVDNKPSNEKYAFYTVQPKETLFTISKRFGISIDALMYLNDLKNDQITNGQRLLIPKKLIMQQGAIQEGKAKYVQHKVKPKQTLYSIAREYAVSMEEIKKINRLTDFNIGIGQMLNIPRQLNQTAYIEHKVHKRREKLKKIAGEYKVSVLELKQANPNALPKLKKGDVLRIPVGFVEADFMEKQEIVADTSSFLKEEILSPECDGFNGVDKVFKVAFMLPLYLNEVDSLKTMDLSDLIKNKNTKPFKFIEFYQGALLALEDLEEMGMEVELQLYDIPRDIEITKQVLKDAKLKQTDLIISLVYHKNFELISSFSKTYQIPLVNAVSKRRKIIYDNPYVFKVEPNDDARYKDISEYVMENHSHKNIIIVRSNPYQLADEYNDLKSRLESTLPDYFETDSMRYQNQLHTVVYSLDSLHGINTASSLERENLVIAFGMEEVFAIELFTKLNYMRDSIRYEVIGLPDWSGYTAIDETYSQALAFKTTTAKYIDYELPYVQEFVLDFREKYATEPQLHKYAFLGFDVTKYFLSALYKYGENFPKCLRYNQVDLMENQVQFKTNGHTGYENNNWNIIQLYDYRFHLVR
ncbi:MAG: hypothetical protein B7C24_01930 [Bacteroidetes bacterium 4572_77]|nr:MAG: hypothetical protein B7C24_01930 [Bacteroidetes bacterium 4572_77]